MNRFKHTLTLLSLCILFTLGACREMPSNQSSGANGSQVPQQNTANEDSQFVRMLTELQSKNPKQDAQAAIAGGERHFLCGAGRSRSVPGLTADVYANARERCPTQCLEGVTDALLGANHAKYLDAALQYSAQWNQVMITACY